MRTTSSKLSIKSKRLSAVFAIVGVAIIGAVLITNSRAAGPFVASEAEAGSVAVPAVKLSDVAASNGQAVKFTAGATGFRPNCIVRPSSCGYPDATNTGVPAGVTLTNSGSVTVTQNGAIVQNLNINDGQIIVKANNVTIKNVRISGCTYYPIDNDNGFTGLIVQDSEINSTCTLTTAGLSFQNYTAIRMNIHGTADGFKANSNAVIQDSYVHDLAVTADSHNDGIQSTGGSNVTLRHNTIHEPDGVCVQFGSTDTGWLITENLFSCGGWMINGGLQTNNSAFTNNRFTSGGGYGASSINGTGITWSGNYYDDNGAAVNR